MKDLGEIYVVKRNKGGSFIILGPYINGRLKGRLEKTPQEKYKEMTDEEAVQAIRAIIDSSSTDEEARLMLKKQLGLEEVSFVTSRISQAYRCGTTTMTMSMFMALGPSGDIISG